RHTRFSRDWSSDVCSSDLTDKSALAAGAKAARGAHWVKPELIAEVSFAEWTASGHVRQATFRGLRADKPAKSIERERPVSARAEIGRASCRESGQGAVPGR